MHVFNPLALVSSLLLASSSSSLVAAAPPSATWAERATSTPGLPSTDPFYKYSGNLTSQANGAILNSRAVTPVATNAAKAYQLLYKTTDAIGTPDATVVTILVPKTPKAGAPKIVGLQLPEDSVSIDCAPSAALANGTNSPAAQSLATTSQGLEGSLQNGYYVVIPDHEGSKAQAFVGPTEGRATLDGLLAATAFPTAIPGVDRSTPIAIGGYSGGAHATAWAAQLYSTGTASQLNIRGQVIGGTPVNLTSTLLYLNKGSYLGFAIVGVAGEVLAYPDIRDFITPNLYPNGTALFKDIQDNKCLLNVAFNANYARKDLFSYFKLADPLSYPVPQKRLAENLLGGDGSKLSIGTIMYHGEADDVIPYQDAVKYAKSQCSKGAMVHFYSDPGAKHIQEEGSRGASFVQWLDDVLSGKADFSCNL
ncbi:hypothetical protein OC842_002108 [Tilletia horrida]|uniref:triacylglycerol lipase n=1 Tax=Tilletia horrida TaxID=155126 RepID=A0AAN6GIM2_9BASI|nr:hypothetical protein OC842_002108 [Tilletia horrida]